MEDYRFLLDINTEQTGFYMVRDSSFTCNDFQLAANRSQTDLVSGSTIRLTVVRCGLGQEDAKFEVRGQRQGGNWPEFHVAETGAIPQPWHLSDGVANYFFLNNVDAPTGVRPDFVPVDYYTESTAQMLKGATAWAGLRWEIQAERVGDIFKQTQHDKSPYYDFRVEAFWDTRYPCRASSQACVSRFPSGEHPHLTPSETRVLAVKYPPRGFSPEGDPTEWTVDPKQIERDPKQERYFYLPYIMVHELGHILGLHHIPGEHMMEAGYPKGKTPATREFSEADKNLVKEVVSSHGHQ